MYRTKQATLDTTESEFTAGFDGGHHKERARETSRGHWGVARTQVWAPSRRRELGERAGTTRLPRPLWCLGTALTDVSSNRRPEPALDLDADAVDGLAVQLGTPRILL